MPPRQLPPELERYIPRFVQIESGGNPNARSGQYTGLLQMGPDEIRKYGGSDIEHGRALLADRAFNFSQKHGRMPTGAELYLLHQQGEAGTAAHMGNPTGAAWQNVRQYYPNEAVARQAIWGNVPSDMRAQFDNNVNNVSSQAFMDLWRNKVERTGGAPQQPGGAASPVGDGPMPQPQYNTPPPAQESEQTLYERMQKMFGGPQAGQAQQQRRAPPPDLSQVQLPAPPPPPDLMQLLGPRPIDVSSIQRLTQAPMFGASLYGRRK